MSHASHARRILVAVPGAERDALTPLFSSQAFFGWQVVQADSPRQVFCCLRQAPCEIVLLDERLFMADGGQGWLSLAGAWKEAVVVALVSDEADSWVRAY